MAKLPPLPFHVLSAFAPTAGTGSQAAVIIYPSISDPRWLDDSWLQKVSADFNYTATVHIAPIPSPTTPSSSALTKLQSNPYDKGDDGDGQEVSWEIRWFTAVSELALCGHGTIASSYLLFQKYPSLNQINYVNPIAGKFIARRSDGSFQAQAQDQRKMQSKSKKSQLVEINLPSLPSEVISTFGKGIDTDMIKVEKRHPDYDKLIKAIKIKNKNDLLDISEFKYGDRKSFIILIKGDVDLKALDVDITSLGNIASGQNIVTQITTHSSNDNDKTLEIQSRMFFPGAGIPEDTITGSAHTYLTNYYLSSPASKFLPVELQETPGDVVIHATQLSQRGGGMNCILGDGVVRLIGRVREFGRGELVEDDDED
ncbi:uncharacterized protein IL334_000889 [Kwoniella shivajii]|uniref:Phenazine biosynthesis protein n=1 Tax=Kwoniella shivajii TaxID=564305 RepID=A0ABZ1CRH5_9TREE|nr:hypothetical protein IL334_000889 [Kwoniella shivajii]